MNLESSLYLPLHWPEKVCVQRKGIPVWPFIGSLFNVTKLITSLQKCQMFLHRNGLAADTGQF